MRKLIVWATSFGCVIFIARTFPCTEPLMFGAFASYACIVLADKIVDKE